MEEDGSSKASSKDEKNSLNEILHEVPIGKGLSGALKLLKERGNFKEEAVECSGLVDVNGGYDAKEIHIERRDEFGRIMTEKEAFKRLSHRFHGKGPGKRNQEKRMKKELKMMQMQNSDAALLSVEKMREVQARLQKPYLDLSGSVGTGHTSRGSATVEIKGMLEQGSMPPLRTRKPKS